MSFSPLIEIEELLAIYKSPEVLIFDASNGPDAKKNYQATHLEGARFIEVNQQLASIKNDLSKGGRHPLPAPELFTRTLGTLGISPQNHIIIYDIHCGANAAARFWWMLKAIGHDKVQVLNGGFKKAVEFGFPLSSKEVPINPTETMYPTTNWKLPTKTMKEVETVSNDHEYLVIDVRDSKRYAGIEEPIDMIAGHIPGAINIPYTENLDENGSFLAANKLKHLYQQKIGDTKPEKTIVHCGSGITACHTLLAFAYAGIEIPNLYVGSWSEWSRNNKAIVKN